ncbi:quercetin 2,3-dioxygenase [Tautonia rosea]|uniref:quercetin 2,3-dioxygenase n=1 Tax=Tautonia rosea TaxID=2728037 RepID=UPI001473A30F|nr:quercetin 2,3-dioxygenase [Tautonia rosea]
MRTGVTESGEGQSVWLVGDRYTIKASGDDTGGAFSLIEAWVPPQSGPPPHIHHREDEAFYLIEGQLEFHADGQTYRPAPGAWVRLARGSLHWFRNVGETPARMLIMTTPAGLEQFFLEIGRPAQDDDKPTPPSDEYIHRLQEAAPRYGLEIRPPAH